MKKITKRFGLFMAAALVISMLAGCGGSGVRADEKYQGKYVAVLQLVLTVQYLDWSSRSPIYSPLE